jgi:hypothetical protein
MLPKLLPLLLPVLLPLLTGERNLAGWLQSSTCQWKRQP